MQYLVLVLLFASALARAEDFHTEVDTQKYPAEAFSHPGVTVTAMPRHKSDLPTPKERDALFESIGLEPYLVDFDALSRDQLFIRARVKTWDDLIRAYPKIPAALLNKLQAKLQRGEL